MNLVTDSLACEAQESDFRPATDRVMSAWGHLGHLKFTMVQSRLPWDSVLLRLQVAIVLEPKVPPIFLQGERSLVLTCRREPETVQGRAGWENQSAKNHVQSGYAFYLRIWILHEA